MITVITPVPVIAYVMRYPRSAVDRYTDNGVVGRPPAGAQKAPMALSNFTIPDTSPIFTYRKPVICLSCVALCISPRPQSPTVRPPACVGSDKPITSILADGFGLQNGWQTWYTVSGFNKNPGDSSHGDSFHLTSLDGAEVSLEFYGAYLYIVSEIGRSEN